MTPLDHSLITAHRTCFDHLLDKHSASRFTFLGDDERLPLRNQHQPSIRRQAWLLLSVVRMADTPNYILDRVACYSILLPQRTDATTPHMEVTTGLKKGGNTCIVAIQDFFALEVTSITHKPTVFPTSRPDAGINQKERSQPSSLPCVAISQRAESVTANPARA